MTAIVYQYGVQRRADVDLSTLNQMHIAHCLHNHLVELFNAREISRRSAWLTWPALAELQTRIDEVETGIEKALMDAKRQRMTGRDRAAGQQEAPRLAELRRRHAELRREWKPLRDIAYPAVRPLLDLADAAHKTAVKESYSVFVGQRGLGYGTHSAVTQKFATAVSRLMETRRTNPRAMMRFQRWAGEGTLTVQVMRQAGDPVRSPELLASGTGQWRNKISLSPSLNETTWDAMSSSERRQAARTGVIDVCHHRDIRTRLPIIMHRPLPDGADIASVEITRRILDRKPIVTVQITIKLPDPQPPVGRATAAVNCGWRAMPDGYRCAVVTFSNAVAIPDPLADVVRQIGGRTATTYEVRLPAGLAEAHRKLDGVKAIRDQMLDSGIREWGDEMSAALSDLWATQDAGSLREPRRSPDVMRWRSGASVCHWARVLADVGYPVGAEMHDWRRQWLHLDSWVANETDQLVGRRRDAWSRVAAWIGESAGLVIVDAADHAKLRKRPAVDADVTDVGDDIARRTASMAAPGELREAVIKAARRRGVPAGSAPKSFDTHADCGAMLTGDWRAQVMLWCPSCRVAVDQDVNACNLLAGASAAVDAQLAESARKAAARADVRLRRTEGRQRAHHEAASGKRSQTGDETPVQMG